LHEFGTQTKSIDRTSACKSALQLNYSLIWYLIEKEIKRERERERERKREREGERERERERERNIFIK